MDKKELDEIIKRLTSAEERKNQIKLTKAHAEIDAINREHAAYLDGIYDAIKEVKRAVLSEPKENIKERMNAINN